MLRKNNIPKKYGLIKEQSLMANIGSFVDKKNKIYSPRRETKIAVAERATRSLKNKIYRFMEENGHKYLVKMSSFLNTMNGRVKRSRGKAQKEVKNKKFYSFFFTKTRSANTKTPF